MDRQKSLDRLQLNNHIIFDQQIKTKATFYLFTTINNIDRSLPFET